MEFKYCFGYFTDKELDELRKALVAAFEASKCDKLCEKTNSCQECEYALVCGFLTDAIRIIYEEKDRRSGLYD